MGRMVEYLVSGDGGEDAGVSGPTYEYTFLQQSSVASNTKQAFGSSTSTLLSWGSVLSEDGTTQLFDTNNGIWSFSNRARIFIPQAINRVSYEASFLISCPSSVTPVTLTIGLSSSGLSTSHPQYQACTGMKSQTEEKWSQVSLSGQMLPVQEGDFLGFFLYAASGLSGTAFVNSSILPSSSFAPTTKLHVKMFT